MGWRILTINNGGKLSLKNSQLVFTDIQKNKKTVAIEDLEYVILESKEIVITHSLLSKLAEENVLLITTNEKYEPAGVLYSFFNHYKGLEIFGKQMKSTKKFKKELGKKIIKQKILNQALCLKKLGIDGYDELIEHSKKVTDTDIKNIEGFSSAYYFKTIFANMDKSFKRQQHYDKNINLLNAALNYTYAILRTTIMRNIIATGLLPYLGFVHISKSNPFNLADDLIEPYRAICDYHVCKHLEYLVNSDDISLSSDTRESLKKILLYQVTLDDNNTKIIASIRFVCNSVIRSLESTCVEDLILPTNWKEE